MVHVDRDGKTGRGRIAKGPCTLVSRLDCFMLMTMVKGRHSYPSILSDTQRHPCSPLLPL
ncbi:unnamed protein product [Periconia digitata]|uniref:Uncharacterized protein n=1 Tax=Periconia digitata TaxID=1303443 RepID=A0A9W4UQB9_9PLEO|nr:unnamed protein product [Periconia digitata]